MRKLFEVYSYNRLFDGNIEVNLSDNIHTDNQIIVDEDAFEKWLNLHERLYYEKNYVVNGQLVSKSFTLTLDEYFYDMTITDIQDDLYDYICIKHLNFDRTFYHTLNLLNSINKHFKL
jgi:hypothetical protein